MASLILLDIAELLTLCGPPGDKDGEASLGIHRPGKVVITDGVVVYAGPEDGGPRAWELPGPVETRSAGGRLVSPGLCDPHTHPIWAGERSREFDLRNSGGKLTYAQIQAAGGGILSTVTATGAATDEALVAGTEARLSRLLAQGVTRCEAKTGYGLTAAAELRLLRLLARVGGPVRISPTLLCHVPPPGLGPAERAQLVEELAALCAAARAEGAQALDVYCDEGAFTLAETEVLLRAGRRAGLLLRCHAEQFTHTGAARLAAELGAASVEHLEEIDDEGIAAMARAGTVANLLPGAALTLRLRWPDAGRLIRGGVRVALGTDLNPGSSLTESLPLMMTLGCTQMGMSCAQAWEAVTVNAARAVGGPADEGGRLRPGAPADLVLWDAEGYREVCQHFGVPLCHQVYVGGRVCYPEAPAG